MESKISRIFVHGLKAHADEMWASALLISAKTDVEFVEIIRDAKRLGEATENDFILDCGMKFDGVRLFDHHQKDDLRVEGKCALTLVAETFAPWVMQDSKYGRYFDRIRVQDCTGLPAAEEQFGDSSPYIQAEFVNVALFEQQPLLIAKLLASQLIERKAELDETAEAERWLATHSKTQVFDTGLVAIELTSNPYMEGLTLRGVNAALTELADTVGAHATVGFRPDDPTVRVLFRTPEGARVGLDFRKSKPEKLIFCHNSGFLLNFIPRDDEEWKDLLHEAAAK